MLATPAAAQEDMLTARLSRHVTWDTNVFRLSDGAADPQLARGITGKSDQIATTTVGLSVDKAYSLQQFRFNVSQVATRHDKFSTLDRDAFNYTALWQWQLTPRISGALSADRAESAISFLDTQDLQRNVAVTVNRNATVDGWLFGGWHLLAGISETRRESTGTFVASPSNTQTNGEFGLRYIAASRSSVTATRRLRNGVNTGQAVDLVNFIDSAFKVTESELNAAWIVSGKSTLNGRLTRIERRHKHVPQRDFSVVAGELGYVWAPTGRLSVSVSALRAVAPFTPSTSISYRIDDTLAFAPAWRVTDKTTLRMRAYRQVSDFAGAVVPVAGSPRRDMPPN